MRKWRFDKLLLLSTLALLIAGFLILFSASLGLKNRTGATFESVMIRQLFFGAGLGVFLMYVFSRIDYRIWKKFALPFFIFSLLLTALVFVPGIGFFYGGARRWISVFGISFQPSELLKFAYVVYLALWLSNKKEEIKSFIYGLFPFLIILGAAGALIIKEPDTGTFGVMALTGVAMYILGGGRFRHVLAIILIGALALFLLIKFEPYRMSRWEVFMNPDLDQTGAGYQLKQSKIALGSGGLFGRGLGMSVQKFSYLPEPIGDSVFSVFGEEFGFVGAFALITGFLFFASRGLSVAKRAPDSFGRLLGSGIVILIIIQAFVNIASMTGLIPMTGVPLSFVSKGGSALAITLMQIGVLLNISKHKT